MAGLNRGRLVNTPEAGVDAWRQATVRIPNDFDETDWSYAQSTIIHELLHVLGIWGHVDHIEFPDSLMSGSGEFFPKPGVRIEPH